MAEERATVLKALQVVDLEAAVKKAKKWLDDREKKSKEAPASTIDPARPNRRMQLGGQGAPGERRVRSRSRGKALPTPHLG